MDYLTLNNDRFTEAIDTPLEDHTADTGEGWTATAPQFQCNAARGAVELVSKFGTARRAMQASGGQRFLVGHQVFSEIYRAAGHAGANHTIGFYCMLDDSAPFPVEYYYFQVEFQASIGIKCHRAYSGGSQFETILTAPIPSFDQSTWLRIGMTIVSAHEYDVWWEPRGGGTRFAIGTWSPIVDANYDFLNSAAHQRLGIIANATNFTTENPAWDNLTHQKPDVEPTPVISGRLSYQRVMNVARNRSRDFQGLVIDDNVVMDELNALTLELIQEGTDADHTAFQQVLNWSTDVLPSLGILPAPADLTEIDNIWLPYWVNTIFTVEGIQSSGKKIEIIVRRKESENRDRVPGQDEGYYGGLLETEGRKPLAFKVWDPTESVWKLFKDLTTDSQVDAWADITDVNIVVAGVYLPMSERADMTDPIPVPFRALRPLAEAYALILGGRVNKSAGWMREQRLVKDRAWEAFREFVNQMDMASYDSIDPEVGMW